MPATYVTEAELRANLQLGNLYSSATVEEVCQAAENVIRGNYSKVGGGSLNTVSGDYSATISGTQQKVVGNLSTSIASSGVTISGDSIVVLGMNDVTATTSNTVYLPNVEMVGSLNRNVSFVNASADPTLNDSDFLVLYDSTSPGGTITLPAAKAGKEVLLIRINNTNSSDVVGQLGSLLNGSGVALSLPITLYSETRFVSDGTDWYGYNSSPL